MHPGEYQCVQIACVTLMESLEALASWGELISSGDGSPVDCRSLVTKGAVFEGILIDQS